MRIECSTLVDHFLNADKNRLTAVVNGKRKLEAGLVVPTEFRRMKKQKSGSTKKQNIATILHRELEKKKEKYSGHFILISDEYNGKMSPSTLQ